jgi:hypothetical protein
MTERLPMLGRVVEADFSKNTLTLEMSGEADYYARASEYVLLPREAWDWLMGLGDAFEPGPDALKIRGKVAAYWWRSELRKRIAKDAAVQPYAASERPE